MTMVVKTGRRTQRSEMVMGIERRSEKRGARRNKNNYSDLAVGFEVACVVAVLILTGTPVASLLVPEITTSSSPLSPVRISTKLLSSVRESPGSMLISTALLSLTVKTLLTPANET